MNTGIDAVNYCHTRALYLKGIESAQRRANINNTVELVIYCDINNTIIDETTVRPQPTAKAVKHQWH